jgi:hypothetical protein
LEIIFDSNDISTKTSIQSQENDGVNCNIGTDVDPNIIKLSKTLKEEQRNRYVDIMKEFVDIFAWSYEYINNFDTQIIQYKIPLKKGTKPFRKKLRQHNPMFLPIIEKQLKKLLDVKIIEPLRYSEWVDNLAPVRNKSGEIRLCVDFRNLNQCSLKDNYPLPNVKNQISI